MIYASAVRSALSPGPGPGHPHGEGQGIARGGGRVHRRGHPRHQQGGPSGEGLGHHDRRGGHHPLSGGRHLPSWLPRPRRSWLRPRRWWRWTTRSCPVSAAPRRPCCRDAPLVHRSGNLLAHKHIQRGNAALAIARSKHVLTQRLYHPLHGARLSGAGVRRGLSRRGRGHDSVHGPGRL